MNNTIYKIIFIFSFLLMTSSIGFSELVEKTVLVEEQLNQIELKVQSVEKFFVQEVKDERKVAFNVKVLQILLNEEHLMGVDWEAIVSDYKKVNDVLSLGTISQEDYVVLLEALDTVGEIHTILETKTITKNTQSANVTIDTIFAHFLEKEEERRSNEIIDLNLYPEIGDAQNIAIHTQYQLDASAQVAEAVVNVQNESTVILGSIFKKALVSYTKKFPLLGDIPFLGVAFRNQRERERITEVIIFLTPKIVIE
ncbi:hypothetical protein MNBD_UNCLBAC01-1244 [hydrothermal vent metagenome]|uniref:Type II/III secretion system secretin-like domain-containing protein n=1 Tax=hydrothermal vent metagenome TaxID=652676 RepID=A0A3B1D7L1_9ZZZZ